jgi:hypothetical protein
VCENRIEHDLAIPQYVVVPEAKHFPALLRQIGVSGLVADVLSVLRTVGLDDEPPGTQRKFTM